MTYAVSNSLGGEVGYIVYNSYKQVGYMIPIDGILGSTSWYAVYRMLEDATVVYMGNMSMGEADNLYTAIYE
jgi:hypothetical protein